MWDLLRHILEFSGWQGIAGIAQVLAAVFALLAVRQARTMIQTAESERLQSTLPLWEPDGVPHIVNDIMLYFILRNVGRGAALDPLVRYVTDDGNPAEVTIHVEGPGHGMVASGDFTRVT